MTRNNFVDKQRKRLPDFKDESPLAAICSPSTLTNETDEVFRQYVNESSFAMLIVNTEGRIIYINKSSVDLLGYTPNAILGKEIETVLPKNLHYCHRQFKKQYLKNPNSCVMELGTQPFVLLKGGKQIPVEIRLSPINFSHETFIIYSFIDITLRMQAEEMLHRTSDYKESEKELLLVNLKLEELEKKYELLNNNIPELSIAVSLHDHIILECSALFVDSLGYVDKAELIGKPITSLLTAEFIPKLEISFENCLHAQEQKFANIELVKKNGDDFNVNARLKMVEDDDKGIKKITIQCRNSSLQNDLEAAQQKIAELNLIYQCIKTVSEKKSINSIFKKVLALICKHFNCAISHLSIRENNNKVFDAQAVWYFLNENQYKRTHAVSKCLKEARINLHNLIDEHQSVQLRSLSSSTLGNFNRLIGIPIMVNGRVNFIIEMLLKSSSDDEQHMIDLFNDFSHQIGGALSNKIVEIEKQQLAYYDAATQLPNREFFKKVLQKTIDTNKKENIALLQIKFNNLKHFNNNLGFETNQDLMLKISSRIKGYLENLGFLASLGGDEFAMFIKNVTSQTYTIKVTKNIFKLLSAPIHINDYEIKLSLSIGIAIYPYAGKNVDTLLHNVNIAAYRAVSSSKSKIQFFSEKLSAAYNRKLLIESELKHAIENNEFYLVFQPQIKIDDGEICAFETLLRWDNPKIGAIGPDEYIPIAEEIGCLPEIGEWVFAKACQQLQQWNEENTQVFLMKNIRLSINLSPAQLSQKNICKTFFKILKRYQVDAKQIVLEVTETAVMENLTIATSVLQTFHDQGMGVAIDDFGKGYSSLGYLKTLPLTELKIDKIFVKDLISDDSGRAMVEAIIKMGKSFGLDIVAEGIENEATLNLLKYIGCHFGQGFHISKPLPADSVMAFVETNNLATSCY